MVTRTLEACFCGFCWTLLLMLGWRNVHRTAWPEGGLTVLFAALVGCIATDFAAGLAHWFCDTFFEEDTPVIGPYLIGPFREHHRDPLAMTAHGFLEVNGNSCLILIPFVA